MPADDGLLEGLGRFGALGGEALVGPLLRLAAGRPATVAKQDPKDRHATAEAADPSLNWCRHENVAAEYLSPLHHVVAEFNHKSVTLSATNP